MTNNIEAVGAVFRASWDNVPDWWGEAIYADLFSAQLLVPEDYKEWMQEQDPYWQPGVFSWLPIGWTYHHLYEDGEAVGIVVKRDTVFKVTP